MSGSPPFISIVLPTYNGSRYLEGSVESVRRQTLADWELVIVDDCSTDGTPELIRKLAARDARIRPHRNETNQRLPRSLNVGFSLARGSLLTWTSDDNEYRPGALAAMAGYLGERPDVDLVYCDAMDIDDEGRELGRWRAGEPGELAWVNCVNACFLYRRRVHESLGGYDPGWVLVEDWDFWLRASVSFRLAALHQDQYLYRRHSGSLSSTRKMEVTRARVRLMEHWMDRLPWLTAKGRCEICLKLARACAELGDGEAVRRFNRLALRHAPSKAAATLAGRALLGRERAGALAQAARRMLGRR